MSYNHSDTSTHIDEPSTYTDANRTAIYDTNYQCDPNNSDSQLCGTLGTTYWCYANEAQSFTISANSNATISFTGTEPSCYYGKDVCLLTFTASLTNNDTNEPYVELKFRLNNAAPAGLVCLSPVQSHGGQNAFDISRSQNYCDVGLNTFVFMNTSTSGTVLISNLRIFRTYRMSSLGTTGCADPVDFGNSGSLDQYRHDFPCNLMNCTQTNWRSFSEHIDKSSINYILNPNTQITWSFDWSLDWTQNGQLTTNQFNYSGPDACIFNINQVTISGSQYANDVKLFAYLNEDWANPFAAYYISAAENSYGMYPSYDLKTVYGYQDTGPNSVTLKNVGSYPVNLADTYGLNIYRYYTSTSFCPPFSDFTDTFSDHSDNPFSDQAHSDYNDYGYDDCYHGDIVYTHSDSP